MEKLELVAAGGISPVRTDPDLVLSIIPSHLHIKCDIYSLDGDTVTKLGL